jgi:predicted RNase H-like nuclease (RuvC/YqgF family)
VSGLWFDYEEKEKSFKIVEKYFIEIRTEVQATSKDQSKLKEIMWKKVSELEASSAEKDKHIASHEVELKRAKEEYETEIYKIRQASAKTTIDISATQVKIGDLNDEVNHVRQLNDNYRILEATCYTLDNRCYNELMKTFSSVEATSWEKFFANGDLLSETHAYKSVL